MTRKQLETSASSHCCFFLASECYVEPNLICFISDAVNNEYFIRHHLNKQLEWKLTKNKLFGGRFRGLCLFAKNLHCACSWFLLIHVARDRKVNPSY